MVAMDGVVTYISHTHTHILWPFFRDYSGEPLPGESSSGVYGARGDIKRQTHQQSGWAPLHPD